MLEKGKISLIQMTILVMLFSLGSAILIVPTALASVAKQDGWISAIIGAGLGSLVVWLYIAIGKRHPDKTLIECCEEVLGVWAGKLVGLLYVQFFFLLATLVLRNIGDFITTIVMPDTPIQAIHILFLLIIMMGARLGLEVIGRTAEIFLPWICGLILVLMVFIVPQMESYRLAPLFENGFNRIIYGSFSILSIPYLELVVFLMILPYVNHRHKAGSALLAGSLLGGGILILISALSITVLGWEFTARHAFPSYTLAKKIQLGEFLQRIEVMMAIIWFMTIFFKLTVCFYASALSIAQVFRTASYRPLVLPLGMIMVILSLVVYPNIVYFREFASKIWTSYAMVFGLVLPLVLLLASLAASRRRNKGSAQEQGAGSNQEQAEAGS